MLSVRILLVDDYPDFLESAARFLSTVPQVDLVGHAFSGPEAIQQSRRLRPDLVLMDLAMPDMNGLEATRQIKAQIGAPRVVILSLYDNPAYRRMATAAGADYFLNKSDLGEALVPLVHELFALSDMP